MIPKNNSQDFQSLAGQALLRPDQRKSILAITEEVKKRLRFQINDESSSSSSTESAYESNDSKRRKLDNISNAKQDWLLIICSYKRAETLRQKTLNYLTKTDISLDRVRIIVGNATEYINYIETFGENWKSRIIIGEVGLHNAKNFTSRYFPEGPELFFMDDDVIELLENKESNHKKDMTMVVDITKFITDGFVEAKRVGASLWGLYPVCNPYFMKMVPISYDLKFIIGTAYGYINSHSPAALSTMDEGDDYERNMKAYLRDGKVVRFNRFVARSPYNKGTGGLMTTRSLEGVQASKERLVEMFPELCSLGYRWKKGLDRSRKDALKAVKLLLRGKRGTHVSKKREPARIVKDWGTCAMELRPKGSRKETSDSDMRTESRINKASPLPLFSRSNIISVIIHKQAPEDKWDSTALQYPIAFRSAHFLPPAQQNTIRITAPQTPKNYLFPAKTLKKSLREPGIQARKSQSRKSNLKTQSLTESLDINKENTIRVLVPASPASGVNSKPFLDTDPWFAHIVSSELGNEDLSEELKGNEVVVNPVKVVRSSAFARIGQEKKTRHVTFSPDLESDSGQESLGTRDGGD